MYISGSVDVGFSQNKFRKVMHQHWRENVKNKVWNQRTKDCLWNMLKSPLWCLIIRGSEISTYDTNDLIDDVTDRTLLQLICVSHNQT